MDLDDLRSSARSKADETATDFITTIELDRYINQGLRYVYGKIAQRFEDYFVVPGTVGNDGLISTVSGTQAYDLPDDLMKIVRVEHRAAGDTNDNNWRRMERLNISNDRLDDYYPVREGYSPSFGYFVGGNKVYLRPVPTTAFSVRIWFVPRVTVLSAGSDIPGVPDEFQELIAEYAALQCLRKSGEGIYKEASDIFQLELQNMIENIEVRDQQAEQMVITDDSDWDRFY